MEKNVHIFDEEDENKLEYTSVYESYVGIMDDLMDHKLVVEFGEDAVQEFYKDISVEMEKYSALDQAAFNTIQSFLDFQAFKKQMMEVKSAVKN